MWIESAFDFLEMKGVNALLIIYHPLTDSQLNFINVLLADLKLETETEDSNEGAKVSVIALFGKVLSKDSRGNEKRPHRPCRRCETRTIFCWVGN